ncbi:hypothetical protein [Flavobacterium tegetincola]|uniref:hypothetical protein n=1 Tax=Flavobacterium tegetincola TaxID=150172 RepID=UPI00146DBFB6
MASVNKQINEIIKLVQHSKLNHPSFKLWDLKTEQNPETYIVKGSIDLSDDVAFKHCFLTANCLGKNYVRFQIAAARHPNEACKLIWFPKLYKNGGWDNSI